MKPLAYVAHPVGPYGTHSLQTNLQRATIWRNWCIQAHPDRAFLAPYIGYCEALDDTNPAHRERGMADMIVILGKCDELWLVGGFLSPGMKREQLFAVQNGIAIHNLLTHGDFPPPCYPEKR